MCNYSSGSLLRKDILANKCPLLFLYNLCTFKLFCCEFKNWLSPGRLKKERYKGITVTKHHTRAITRKLCDISCTTETPCLNNQYTTITVLPSTSVFSYFSYYGCIRITTSP